MAAGRQSKVRRLDPEAREYIEQLIREDTLTLDEMMDAIRMRFPAADVSRSGVHRYRSGYEALRERTRELDRVSQALVGGLGEGVSEKASALLAHAVTTAVTHAALRVNEQDDADMSELKDLALAAGRAIKATHITVQERIAYEKIGAERAMRESRAKVEQLGKTGAIDPAVVAQVIKAAYDL